MTRLTWDIREYESGLDRGVFYPPSGDGEAWNGLTSVKESPSDADERVSYLDGVKVHRNRRGGDFAGTIEAFTYPKSFYEDILMPRRPPRFNMSYCTHTANSYKIHLVYNVLLAPSGQLYQQSEADQFSWDFVTAPVKSPGGQFAAHFVIDANVAYPWTVTALESVLYGDDSGPPRMPLPQEVIDLFEANAILHVYDHGDGSFTVTGPDAAIAMLDPTTFEITWPSAISTGTDTYQISSL